MYPARNREMVLEVLTGNWDFKEWLGNLGIQLSGLTPNPWSGELHVMFLRLFRSTAFKQLLPLTCAVC